MKKKPSPKQKLKFAKMAIIFVLGVFVMTTLVTFGLIEDGNNRIQRLSQDLAKYKVFYDYAITCDRISTMFHNDSNSILETHLLGMKLEECTFDLLYENETMINKAMNENRHQMAQALDRAKQIEIGIGVTLEEFNTIPKRP